MGGDSICDLSDGNGTSQMAELDTFEPTLEWKLHENIFFCSEKGVMGQSAKVLLSL